MTANDPTMRIDIITEALWQKILEAVNATPLPSVGGSDKNKYLHTNGSTGAVEWATISKELPNATASDKDKYLHLNESTGAKEWVTIANELPTKPTTDGTYNLVCTVDEGVATLSWVSATQGGE